MRTLTCMPREPLVFGQPRSPSSSSSAFTSSATRRTSAQATPGVGIEIDAQLVGMIEIAGAHRVRMQLDAAEVDDPGEAGRVVDHDLLGGAPGRKGERHRPQPLRPLLGRALLVERLALGAVDEALQHDRPIADAAQRAGRHREVVADEVELRELRLPREIGLVRVGDPDLAPVDREHRRFRCLGHDFRLACLMRHGKVPVAARPLSGVLEGRLAGWIQFQAELAHIWLIAMPVRKLEDFSTRDARAGRGAASTHA